MRRSDLDELHYIAHIDNVPSILAQGILCYERTQALSHVSVAMLEIQERRAKRIVPGGLPLHKYANLYICARNPMLYKRLGMHLDLIVLRVSTEVLDLPGTIIADGNASSDYTAFWPSPVGLERVQGDLVFAEYWTDDDLIEYWRKKRIKCAEVLVPGVVEPRFITGAYVSCQESKRQFRATSAHLPVTINGRLFFRD